jgi:hypothetical protein
MGGRVTPVDILAAWLVLSVVVAAMWAAVFGRADLSDGDDA